jgi:hypothetical protein
VRDAVVNRTNNALERYNRTLNEEFPTAHPKMPDFVQTINRLSKEYYAELKAIQARTSAPRKHRSVNIPDLPDDYATFVPAPRSVD